PEFSQDLVVHTNELIDSLKTIKDGELPESLKGDLLFSIALCRILEPNKGRDLMKSLETTHRSESLQYFIVAIGNRIGESVKLSRQKESFVLSRGNYNIFPFFEHESITVNQSTLRCMTLSTQLYVLIENTLFIKLSVKLPTKKSFIHRGFN